MATASGNRRLNTSPIFGIRSGKSTPRDRDPELSFIITIIPSVVIFYCGAHLHGVTGSRKLFDRLRYVYTCRRAHSRIPRHILRIRAERARTGDIFRHIVIRTLGVDMTRKINFVERNGDRQGRGQRRLAGRCFRLHSQLVERAIKSARVTRRDRFTFVGVGVGDRERLTGNVDRTFTCCYRTRLGDIVRHRPEQRRLRPRPAGQHHGEHRNEDQREQHQPHRRGAPATPRVAVLVVSHNPSSHRFRVVSFP